MEGSGVVHLASKNTPKTLSFGLGSFHQEKRVHLEEIKRLLSQMGDVTLEENFMGVKWSKLLINSSFNGLSAILGYTLGEIAANKTSRRRSEERRVGKERRTRGATWEYQKKEWAMQ